VKARVILEFEILDPQDRPANTLNDVAEEVHRALESDAFIEAFAAYPIDLNTVKVRREIISESIE
jgi:hypothetical protein